MVCLGFRVGGSGVVFGLPVGVFRVWCVLGVGFGVGESLARFGGWWIQGLTLKLSRVQDSGL